MLNKNPQQLDTTGSQYFFSEIIDAFPSTVPFPHHSGRGEVSYTDDTCLVWKMSSVANQTFVMAIQKSCQRNDIQIQIIKK